MQTPRLTSNSLNNFSLVAKTKPIRIALVGCGRVSIRHIHAIIASVRAVTEGSPDSRKAQLCPRLVGLCDLKVSSLERVKRYYLSKVKNIPDVCMTAEVVEPRLYTDLEEMLSQSSPDLLVVATPSGLHVEHGLLGLKYGCHLLVEKPIALDLGSAEKLVDMASKMGLEVFGVMQNRFHPVIQSVNEMLSVRGLGTIYAVTLNILWNRSQSYYNQDEWRGTRGGDGGLMYNQGIHYIDLVRYFVGPIKRVFCIANNLRRGIETDDVLSATLEAESGCVISVCATVLNEPMNYEASVTLVGSNGTIRIGGPTCNRITYWGIKGVERPLEVGEEEDYMVGSWGTGHDLVYKNVFMTLEGSEEPAVCREELLRTIELVEALYLSSERGEVVEVGGYVAGGGLSRVRL